MNCRVCEYACPPEAIGPVKQMVRGNERWYVDFDRCLPFFNETYGCAICIAVCPWSRPGVGQNLAAKLARRADRMVGNLGAKVEDVSGASYDWLKCLGITRPNVPCFADSTRQLAEVALAGLL